MKLLLFHGREDPGAEMDDWGSTGPVIEGIRATHTTYLGSTNLYFHSVEAAQKAAEQTGWPLWDSDSLAMKHYKDLIQVGDVYYGDWEFQDD